MSPAQPQGNKATLFCRILNSETMAPVHSRTASSPRLAAAHAAWAGGGLHYSAASSPSCTALLCTYTTVQLGCGSLHYSAASSPSCTALLCTYTTVQLGCGSLHYSTASSPSCTALLCTYTTVQLGCGSLTLQYSVLTQLYCPAVYLYYSTAGLRKPTLQYSVLTQLYCPAVYLYYSTAGLRKPTLQYSVLTQLYCPAVYLYYSTAGLRSLHYSTASSPSCTALLCTYTTVQWAAEAYTQYSVLTQPGHLLGEGGPWLTLDTCQRPWQRARREVEAQSGPGTPALSPGGVVGGGGLGEEGGACREGGGGSVLTLEVVSKALAKGTLGKSGPRHPGSTPNPMRQMLSKV